MIHVLGISIWIHFIWIFVLGVLLFFHLVHGTVFEGYQVGGGSSTGGGGSIATPVIALSSTSSAPVWVERYQIQSGTWLSGASTDRLLYLDKLPKGGKLVSSKGLFTLLFHTDGRLILYNSSVGVTSNSLPTSSGCSGSGAGSSACINGYPILWSFSTGSASSYLQHRGTNIRMMNADESASASQPFSSPAATSTDLNKSYLHILDTGELVWFASDGTTLYSTGTAVANVSTACGEVDFTSPLDQSDCFSLSRFLEAKLSDISTFSSNGSTLQLDGAQKALCGIQAYYSALSCDAYRATVPVVRSLPTFDVLAPSASIKGSISIGSDTIITTGDLTSSVFWGYIVYLGYGTNIQGPFVVEAVTSNTILITKKYIGAPITNAIISITLASPFMDTNSEPEVMKVSGLEIVAAAYPRDKHISIGSSLTSPLSGSGTPTICGSASDGQRITLLSPSGPFTGIQSIYYGTPVGNCTNGFQAGVCNALEADLASFRNTVTTNCVGKTTCDIFVTQKTISGCSAGGPKTLAVTLSTAATGDNLPKNIEIGDIIYIRKSECNPYDTDNGDGTCTARLCKIGEIDDQKGNCIPYECRTVRRFVDGPLDFDNMDGTCTSPTVYNNNITTISPTTLETTSVNTSVNIELRVNDLYSLNAEVSYTTPAMALGFVYDKTRRGDRLTAYSKLTANPALPTYRYSKKLGPFVVASRPTTNKIRIDTLTLPVNVLNTGRLDSNKRFILHPAAQSRQSIIEEARANDGMPINMYTPGVTSYSGIEDLNALPEAGLIDAQLYKISYSDGVFRGSFTSIIAGRDAINERISKTITTGTSGSEGIRQTGVDGKQIDLTGGGQKWDGKFTIRNFNPFEGLEYTLTLSVSSTANTYIALEDALEGEYPPDTAQGSSIIQGSNPNLSSPGALNNKVLVTPVKQTFVWKFIQRYETIVIRAYKTGDTAAVTFTFSYLEIKGGVNGPVTQLACSNGSTTTNGFTQCNPSAADVAAGSASIGSTGAAANAAATAAATAALGCANGTAPASSCGGGSSGSRGSSGSAGSSGSRGSNSGSSPLTINKIQWAADAAAAAATNAGGRPEQVLAAARAAAIQAGAAAGSAASTTAELAQQHVDKQIMNQ